MTAGIQPLRLAGGDIGCLLIHGFTSCSLDLRTLTEYLHGQCGFTAHEVLLPGHGTSPQDMAKFGCSDWLNSVETSLVELEKQCSKVWLIGFSMGGVLASILASRQDITGLISISAPIWPRAKLTRYAFLLQYFRKYAQLKKRPKFEVPSWRYEQVAVANIADLNRAIGMCKTALPLVRVPTLVIQGDADRTIEPRSANYIYNGLGSTDKELVFVSGGHMLLLESRRQEIHFRISEFIKTRIGGMSNGRY